MINKSVCIYDTGFFVPLAERMVKEFKKVYYFCPWESGDAHYRDYRIGTGIDGVERLKYFWKEWKNIDFFIFPDYTFPDVQDFLRSEGKLVWGFAYTAWLESDRFALREWQEDNGLCVPECEEYIGIDDVEKNIKEEHYLKLSEFRGDMETLKHYSFKTSQQFFDELRVKLGSGGDEIQFITESPIDGTEGGYDTWTINGQHPKKVLCGYEEKNGAYLSKWIDYDQLAPQLKKVDEKLIDIFKAEQTKGCYSTEIMCSNMKDGYLLDFTARNGNPPYQLYLVMIENLGEVFYNGAQGIVVEPILKARWGAITIMESAHAVNNDLPILIDEKVKDFVTISNKCVSKGIPYSLPKYNIPGVGAVTGMGNTMDEAAEHCRKNAEGVQAYQLVKYTDDLDKVKKKVFEGRQKNIIL